jgi:hypothetical protein
MGVDKVKSFSVNPFEIWVVSEANKLFRCQLPCKAANEFQFVSSGIRHVALGLEQVWTIDTGNNVKRVRFDFARSKKQVDFKNLKWSTLDGKMNTISIAEDGDVWGIRAQDCRLVRYHAPAHKWLLADNIQAKRVSVGSDYIYIVDQKGATKRCQRPCWNIKFDPLDRQFNSIHAEFSGIGVLYGTTLEHQQGTGNLIAGLS